MKPLCRLLAALVALAGSLCVSVAGAGPLYRIESAQTIKSPSTPSRNARAMALDAGTKNLYLVADDGALGASKTWNTGVAPLRHKHTFTLLTLSRH